MDTDNLSIEITDMCVICFETSGKLEENICNCIAMRYHKKCIFEWIKTKCKFECEVCNKLYRDDIIEAFVKHIEKENKKMSQYEMCKVKITIIIFLISIITMLCMLW